MTFSSEWASAKKNFEGATAKKKPSATFLGVVKKSSGLTPAFQKLDEAIAKKDGTAAVKALEAAKKLGGDYQKVVVGSIKGEDKTCDGEAKVLVGEITQLLKDATAEVKTVAQASGAAELQKKAAESRMKAWTAIVAEVGKSKVPSSGDIKSFCADKAFGIDPATGKADPRLQAAQGKAKANFVAFAGHLTALKGFKPDAKNEAASKKTFVDMLLTAQDDLSLINGVMSDMAEWRMVVQGGADRGKAYSQSPLAAKVNKANEALSIENQRLGIIERNIEKLFGR